VRIGVSARSLAYASGGPTEYLIGLLDALVRIDRVNEYVLFYPNASFLGRYPDCEEVSLDADNRLVFDWLKLPKALRERRIDVAFFPSSNMPPRIPCKAVTAILDLGYFHEGERMYRLADTLYMRPMIRYAARRSQALIAISEFTRGDVIRRLGAPPDKVTAIALAADPIYAAPADAEAIAAFRKKRGLENDYLLYSGNISPRKNLPVLLEAFARTRDELGLDLVMTGGRSWDQDFARMLAAAGLSEKNAAGERGDIVRLGHIPKKDMPLLYGGAWALAFPSRFEGFGLPVLEAQACKTPVVCAGATALPEAAGQGALYFDPNDAEELGDALRRLKRDPALRERLVNLGLGNAARHTWEKTARETLAVFEAVGRKA